MKQLFTLSTLCSALFVLGSAAPGNAEIVLDFSTAGGGTSDISTTPGTIGGNPNTVVSLHVQFNTLAVSGAASDNGTATGLTLDEYYCATSSDCTSIGAFGLLPGNIYVTGTALGVTGSLSGVNTPPLVTIALSGALTGNVGTSPTFSLIFPTDVSSVTVNPGLLAALGATGATPALTAMTNVESGGGGGSYTVTSSATLDLGGPVVTTFGTVPEPGTWLMMAVGMSLIVLAVARKSSRRAE
jgi:PEP-CTERM motif